MKYTNSPIFKNFKKYQQKTTVIFLLISGLYIQQASAQEKNKHENKIRREEGFQHTMRHENNIRNRQIVRENRPVNTTRINRVNSSNNTTTNNNTVNRTVNNRVTVVNRSVNNNYRRPVYNAGNPNWRYANLPRRNTVFTTVPIGYRTINYGGFGYRYYNGIFYRPQNNAFVVIAPPVGIFINTLPFGYRRIYVRNYPYYYYNGTYYDYHDNNYTVVSPPVGAIVESLPDGFQTITVDGETYYTVDGAQYKPVVQDNGEIWYEVIKAN